MQIVAREETNRFVVEAHRQRTVQGVGGPLTIAEHETLWSGEQPPLSLGDELARRALASGQANEVVLLKRTSLMPSVGDTALYSVRGSLPWQSPVQHASSPLS